MEKITVLCALLFIVLMLPSIAYAQYAIAVSAPSITIDKTVGVPGAVTKGGQTSLTFVDNLGTADYKFAPGAEVSFKLVIKNTSSQTLTDVTVTDILPSYLEVVQTDGTFDAKARTVTIPVGQLNPNQEKTYMITVKIAKQDKLPADKGLFCLVNKAIAKAENVEDSDTAQFCMEKGVKKVMQVPAAGPEAGLLVYGAELAVLSLGLYIRKRFAF
ncbi:MAG TPA: hypothetical protein VJH96_04205 [Patescibacteria group bacterium]|nr:hypothetical protein [Patescibacteria group bacterium]